MSQQTQLRELHSETAGNELVDNSEYDILQDVLDYNYYDMDEEFNDKFSSIKLHSPPSSAAAEAATASTLSSSSISLSSSGGDQFDDEDTTTTHNYGIEDNINITINNIDFEGIVQTLICTKDELEEIKALKADILKYNAKILVENSNIKLPMVRISLISHEWIETHATLPKELADRIAMYSMKFFDGPSRMDNNLISSSEYCEWITKVNGQLKSSGKKCIIKDDEFLILSQAQENHKVNGQSIGPKAVSIAHCFRSSEGYLQILSIANMSLGKDYRSSLIGQFSNILKLAGCGKLNIYYWYPKQWGNIFKSNIFSFNKYFENRNLINLVDSYKFKNILDRNECLYAKIVNEKYKHFNHPIACSLCNLLINVSNMSGEAILRKNSNILQQNNHTQRNYTQRSYYRNLQYNDDRYYNRRKYRNDEIIDRKLKHFRNSEPLNRKNSYYNNKSTDLRNCRCENY